VVVLPPMGDLYIGGIFSNESFNMMSATELDKPAMTRPFIAFSLTCVHADRVCSWLFPTDLRALIFHYRCTNRTGYRCGGLTCPEFR
jgi:hypothetical protein